MNNVVLIGRLVKDPSSTVANTHTGTMTVAKFTVAVDRASKDKGADFINVVAFGANADNIVKYFGKGQRIALRGRIQTGSYEKDGQKVYTTDVILEAFDFLEKKSDSSFDVDSEPELDAIFAGLDDEKPPFM